MNISRRAPDPPQREQREASRALGMIGHIHQPDYFAKVQPR